MGTTKWVWDILRSRKRGTPLQKWPCAGTHDRASGYRSMTDNNSAVEKSIVDELTFSAKTSKRVGWEAWEFKIIGPHQVEVTNASWGFQKADHSYIVGVEKRDCGPLPAECGCKADRYNEEYDCKHKVALATVAGPVVLQAAIECPTPTVNTEGTTTQTLKDKLKTDGGTATEGTNEDTPPLNEAKQEEYDCDDLRENFPCWSCVRRGKRELPE